MFGQSRATLSYSFVNADQGADILYMSIEPEQGDGLPRVNGRHNNKMTGAGYVATMELTGIFYVQTNGERVLQK